MRIARSIRLALALSTLLSPAVVQAATCNVMSFGAVGNGIANDANAVEAAVACAAASAPTGGEVYFPSGKYRLATPKTHALSNARFTFDGATLILDVSSAPALTFSGSHLTFDGNVTLDQNHVADGVGVRTGVLFTGSDVVWKAQTEVIHGEHAAPLKLYRAADTVFRNLHTKDSALVSFDQPLRVQIGGLRATLVSAVSVPVVSVLATESFAVKDVTLSDVDVDLGGLTVPTAIVIGPNAGFGAFDGVKVSNVVVRNNAAFPVGTLGSGLEIVRCDHATVSNAVFRNLNLNGIRATGNYLTLSNVVGNDCGAPCVQLHDPSIAGAFATATLSNVVVLNGGKNGSASHFGSAGIALAPYPGTGTLSLVKLHNVYSYGAAQKYGLAVTRNVSGVVVDGGNLMGSLKTAYLEDPNNASISFSGPIGSPSAALLMANAFFDGTSWARPDASKAAAQLSVDNLGRLVMSSAPSGSGPIVWTTTLLVGADGSLQWANGTPVKKHLSQSYSLNLGAPVSVPGCVQSASQTLAGVALGDVVTVGTSAALPATQQLAAVVTGAGQVVVRVCQLNGAAADPDGGGASYRVDAWQH